MDCIRREKDAKEAIEVARTVLKKIKEEFK